MNSFFEYVKSVKGRDWMGADVGPEVWGNFRRDFKIGDILDRTDIKMKHVISGSAGRIISKPNTVISMLCNSLSSVTDEVDLKYWLGHLLFEYVEQGQGHSRTISEVATFLETHNSKFTAHDVCGSIFSTLQITDGVVFTTKKLSVLTNNLTTTGNTFGPYFSTMELTAFNMCLELLL